MRRIILINILSIILINSFAQKGNTKLIKEYEDTLKIMANNLTKSCKKPLFMV